MNYDSMNFSIGPSVSFPFFPYFYHKNFIPVFFLFPFLYPSFFFFFLLKKIANNLDGSKLDNRYCALHIQPNRRRLRE